MSGVKEYYRGKNVRVFRLERDTIVDALRHGARRLLAEQTDALAVWLFGSLARDDASPGSDADVLVVVRDNHVPFFDRSRHLTSYFEGCGVGCDVLVYTTSEFDVLALRPSIVRTAREEGMQLAARESAGGGC